MKINHEKFERLIKAITPYVEFISEIPFIKELEYGRFDYDRNIDTRLYTINHWTEDVDYINAQRLINELTDEQLKTIVEWALNKLNPIEE